MTKTPRPKMQTLENPLLYRNFLQKVRKIDPHFDEQTIDRTLTPEEALREAKERHGLDKGPTPGLADTYVKEIHDMLEDDLGIKHPALQNFIIREMTETPAPGTRKALDQSKIVEAAYIMQMRPELNVKRDIGRKAKPCKNLQEWVRRPNHCDIEHVDSKAARFVKEWFGSSEG